MIREMRFNAPTFAKASSYAKATADRSEDKRTQTRRCDDAMEGLRLCVKFRILSD
jgi:hypothetical protein